MRRRSRGAMAVLGLALVTAAPGCAQSSAGGGRPTAVPATPVIASADTNGGGVIPAGFGTKRQEDVAIKLQLLDVLVKLTPLDEDVIRTLSPDSYRALRELADSRRAAVARLAAQHGLVRGNLWYVSFYGLAPEARFSPLELTVTSAGRDFRPLEVLPLSSGFGEQRLQPRETQSALYLFDDALDVNQPLTVALSGVQNTNWATTLREIERERALIKSRAAQKGPPAP